MFGPDQKPFTDERGAIAKRDDGTVLTGYDVRIAPDIWEKLPYNQLVGRILGVLGGLNL